MIYKPEKDVTTMTEDELEKFLASINPDEVESEMEQEGQPE